jgi:hypothetical protein
MLLATYLPFYRIHEIKLYFIKNIEMLKPKVSIVYLDNIYNQEQKKIIEEVVGDYNIEIKTGNWRNRNDTWLYLLQDFYNYTGEWIVVDSDNIVMPYFLTIHHQLRKYPIYTILDEEAWKNSPKNFLIRSRYIGTIDGVPIYTYRVFDGSIRALFRGGSIFFIGPKQVVTFTKLPDLDIIKKVSRALSRVDIWLRNFISDETLLGVIAYLSDIEEVPWTIASHHYHHGSTPGTATKAYVALAHYQFGKSLFKEFRKKEFAKYYIKYSLSFIKNLIKVL